MKAIRIHHFGSSEVLQYEEVPTPEPEPDELLIKIEAAALNREDLAVRKGSYRIAADELPVIPGREFAGTIAKVGDGVQDFKVGQRVVACTGRGGYAEYALAKLSQTLPLPDGVDTATAAAMPTVRWSTSGSAAPIAVCQQRYWFSQLDSLCSSTSLVDRPTVPEICQTWLTLTTLISVRST